MGYCLEGVQVSAWVTTSSPGVPNWGSTWAPPPSLPEVKYKPLRTDTISTRKREQLSHRSMTESVSPQTSFYRHQENNLSKATQAASGPGARPSGVHGHFPRFVTAGQLCLQL